MASIGPTLPPAPLTKRKRTSTDEDASARSPPSKIRGSVNARRANNDEIDLDGESESDDGYGTAPAATAPAEKSIGPSFPVPEDREGAENREQEIIGPEPPQGGERKEERQLSIGPTLPENGDEIAALDDKDEEEVIGPSAPSPLHGGERMKEEKLSIGPTLPPPTTAANEDEIALDSEDDDDTTGPAPPPPPSNRRILGPAPPPAPLAQRPPSSPNHSSSDSEESDDGYGPALPHTTSHQSRQALALEAAEAADRAARQAGPKRDEWMLLPPTAGTGFAAVPIDTTKMKARRFNSGPRASSSSNNQGEGGGVSSIWTETPEEKRKRLENAVLGRVDPSTHTSTPTYTSATIFTTPEHEDRIRAYTASTRGKSLYEEHQEAKQKSRSKTSGPTSSSSGSGAAKKGWLDEEEDDPSKRAFDKEKDMKLGGRIGAAQRRELLNKAADFGGRFAKGKYL
ncbi:hypothetical protein F5Y17DRAFT_362609 [Xylariaceae sp. FL0594]|nr:hypothetical protein F5Y17DRAFT_362609 [Xylariaceae sp. FL0594]